MKAKWFLLAGLGAMMLGACSSDDDLTPNPEKNPTIEGEGKMILDLKFAGDALSRAQEFEVGQGAESDVNDIHVYFFNDNTEKDFIEYATAKLVSQNPQTGGNVENKIEVTVPVQVVQTTVEDGKKANIVVVLNKHNKLGINFTNFSAFNAALEGIGDNAGFMMSNSTYKGAEGIQYFVKIDGSNIAKEGATLPKPVTVYVERLCSKVTLDVNKEIEYANNALVELKNWGLNVKNTKEYPVKVLTDEFANLTADKWPGAAYWDGASNFRSYWAIDPNYEQAIELVKDDFTKIKFADLTTKQGESEYCLENTFSNSFQKRDQTTTAVIYAQYTPQLDGNTEEGEPIKHQTWIAKNNRFYSQNTFVGNFLKKQNIWKKESEDKYVSATAEDVEFTYTPIKIEENTQTIGGKDYALAKKENVTLYNFIGSDPSNAKPNEFVEYSKENWETLNTEFTNYCSDAKIYIDGFCYYEIYIRHFNEQEVPLVADKINTQSQLGRYGIVRNHSYKLTINKVLNPGKPITGEEITPEDGPDDDTPKYYMNVTINVLSWAVRSQDVEL